MKQVKVFHFTLSGLMLLFLICFSISAQPQPTIQQIINQVNLDTITFHLRELTGNIPTTIGGSPYTIISRHQLQPGNDQAALFIKERLSWYNIPATMQTYSTTGANVIGIKTGTKFPNKKFIISAHFDAMPAGTNSYGADDDGSGTIAVLEAARILSKYTFPFTIVFAFYDEEEIDLLGSKYFADQEIAPTENILGMVTLDMIAYEQNGDNKINIHTRPIANSIVLAQKMVEINTTYSIGLLTNIKNPGSAETDAQTFWTRNLTAVMQIEDDDNDFCPYYHTINDIISNCNLEFYKKNVQLGIATIATLALTE